MILNKDDCYIGETTGLCDVAECGKFVPTKIVKRENHVYFVKNCPIHGVHERLISTDYSYYSAAVSSHLLANTPEHPIINPSNGCPNDCGICNQHEGNMGYIIMEITDECDIRCKTCIAASGPGNNRFKSVKEINDLVDICISRIGHPEFLMISGGEPTIHPDFFDILDNVLPKAKRVFIITNGVKISKELDFVQRLSNYREQIEIYLQFDSFESKTLDCIRGLDLRETRMKAIENLERYQIHSTLVCICKKNINLNEVNSVVSFALMHNFVRGVTFQPIKFLGRGDVFQEESYTLLSEIRTELINGGIFSSSQLIPHHYDPENICIGYFDKKHKKNITTEMVDNGILDHSFFMTPSLSTSQYRYEDLFRVYIVSFLDRFSYNTNAVKQAAICFIDNQGKVIPQNTYYNFHR